MQARNQISMQAHSEKMSASTKKTHKIYKKQIQ